MKKTVYLLFIMILILLMFFSCGNTEDSVKNALDTESDVGDLFKFTLIKGDTSAKEVSSAAVALQNALQDASGKTVNLGTDFIELTKESEFEILIGITKREESKKYSKIAPKRFVIEYVGSKIVIIGGTNADTVDAVEYFIANYIENSENAIKLKQGEKYEYVYEYPRLLINGMNMKDYTIVKQSNFSPTFINALRDRIAAVFGYQMPLTDSPAEKNLFISIDKELGEGKYKNYSKDGSFYITGADSVSLGIAFDEFFKHIPSSADEGEIIDIDASCAGTAAPSVLENVNSPKYFVVETDKDPLSYKVGENIKFSVKLFAGDELRSCPLFTWTISPEGGEEVSGISAGGSGVLELETKMDMPGFVLLTVYACDGEGNIIKEVDKCSAGAAADMENIKVSAEEPEDYEEFWDAQLERLLSFEPVALEMTEDGSTSSHYVYDVKINCPGDTRWTGETYSAIYVSVPKNAARGSLGIQVNFMGAGVRSTETYLSKKSDYICVAVNGHSIPSKMGAEYYSELYKTTLKSYAWSSDSSVDPSEVYYSYMVMRDLQALRWVKSYFGADGEGLWDESTLNVAGMSEGGYQALFTAALDDDVTFCTANIPAMCDKQGVNNGRKKSYGSSLPQMLYYDTCFFARRIKCPVKIMVGLGDVTCVPSGITAMYNELSCDKDIVYVQNMGHTSPDSKKIQQRYSFGDVASH